MFLWLSVKPGINSITGGPSTIIELEYKSCSMSCIQMLYTHNSKGAFNNCEGFTFRGTSSDNHGEMVVSFILVRKGQQTNIPT